MEQVWKKLYDEEGKLVYEGFTWDDRPFGPGITYHDNGSKYQEGIFDTKGLVNGKEYYPNGQIRFEGIFRIHRAYGPNTPYYGKFYSKDGELKFEGRFKLRYGGVGYPFVVEPKEYGPIRQMSKPPVEYVMYYD